MARVLRAQRRGPRIAHGAVLDARAEAERVREQARHDAERIRSEAEREGRAAARAEQAEERLRAAAAQAERLQALEGEALEVALMAAERIVGEAIALEPARMLAIVRELLARVRRASRVSVRVHPEDVAALTAADSDLRAALAAPDATLQIVEDASVRRGGCVLHSDVGSLDARVEIQLEALARALGR